MPSTTFLGMCRLNPNLFMEYVVDVRQAGLHKRVQATLDEHDDAMVRLPRGHGKTTQSAGRVAFDIGQDQGQRVKYVQQGDDEAKKTVRLIKHIIESDRYKQVFPEVIPDRELWGSQAIKVKSAHFSRDPTLEACGIFGRAGGRADTIVADDVCDLKNAIQQPKLRPQVKEAWVNTWLPMLDVTSDRRHVVRKFATPYHIADIVAEWTAMHRADGTLLDAPVVDFKSPWPEAFTKEILLKRRKSMGSVAYARAFELRPVSGSELLFKMEWLTRAFYTEIPRWSALNGVTKAAIDWAFTEENAGNDDPDWSVCLVGRHDNQNDLWVGDMLRERVDYVDFKRHAIQFCRARDVEYATAEGNGPQKGLVQQMNRDADFPVVIAPRQQGKLDKISRATANQAYFESGRFHIRAERDEAGAMVPVPELQPLFDELTLFPAGDHDDTVDAAMDLVARASVEDERLEMPERIVQSRVPMHMRHR